MKNSKGTATLNHQIICWILMSLAVFSFTVQAHELSTSYLSVNLNETGKVTGEVRVNILDLREALAIDLNSNGELTWGELSEATPMLHQYISRNFSFQRNQKLCSLWLNPEHKLQVKDQLTYLVIPFQAQCDTVENLTVNYSMLFEVKSNHKAIVSLNSKDTKVLNVINNPNKALIFEAENGTWFTTFTEFVYQGVYHILIGLDHILFLFTLLLTVALTRSNKQWRGIENKSNVVARTFWIVTSFTIAHSITLSGTALGWLPQFGSWIEVVIAGSILFNVVNNLYPVISKLSLITFVFGLIHGMGFAGALSDLGLPTDQKLLAVVAFNLGVEIGQIMILLLCLPFLLYCRKSINYQKLFMPILSVLIGVIAVYWIIERI